MKLPASNVKPKLHLITSADLLKPILAGESLSNIIPNLNLKWGDAIQVNTDYRNQNKYYWGNNRFYPMCTDHIGPYFDYGVLDKEFSVFDKELPLDYFSDTLYYNRNAFPWTPVLYLKQIIVNSLVNETYFIWRNKKIILKKQLYELDTSMLNGLKELGGGSFAVYDEINKRYTDNMIRYDVLRVLDKTYRVPDFLRGYIYEMHRIKNKEKIIITNPDNLQANDIIMLNTSEICLEELCSNYILAKMKFNTYYSDKLRLNFIDSILKSRYLYLTEEEPTDTDTEYMFEFL